MINLKRAVEKKMLELEASLDQQNFDGSLCMDRFRRFQDARTNLVNKRFNFLIKARKLLGADRYRQLKTEFPHRRVHGMKGRAEPKGPIK
jgi:plasmid replication initiation protein